MRAGYGIVEITPPLGVELAGYGYYLGRKCDSVRDPLFFRAVLLERGTERQLIVSCDVLGLSQSLSDRIIEEAAAFSVPRERVMIVSVHTHTGPAIRYHHGCGNPDPDYVASLTSRVRPLLEAASADLAEVTSMTFARAPVSGDYVYNRAIPDGPVDREARGFFLERKNALPVWLLSAACHGVFLKCVSCVSADFSGELHRLCERAGARSIYLNGLCGDIDPRERSPERMSDFAAAILEALDQHRRSLPLTISGGRLPFTLRLLPLLREGILAAAKKAVDRAGGPALPAARVVLAWRKELLARAETLSFEEPGDAAYCVLGGVPILALPFEGYTGIGMAFRRLAGCPDALVLGCAEELRGYLPTKKDSSSYAALDSPFLYRRLPPVPGEAERLAVQLAEKWRTRSEPQFGNIE